MFSLTVYLVIHFWYVFRILYNARNKSSGKKLRLTFIFVLSTVERT